MPHFHIAQSWGLDYDEIERRAAEGNGPRHGPPLLAQARGETVPGQPMCSGRISQRPVTISADRHTSDLVVRP